MFVARLGSNRARGGLQAVAMEPRAKQQKLFHLRTRTSASVREILNLLKQAEEDPELPRVASARTLGTALEQETRNLIAHLQLPCEGGGHFECPIVRFDRLLPWLLGQCGHFREVLTRMHASRAPTPAAPYKLLFYCDEATPGDVLRLDNRRKAMWLYCTIADAVTLLHHDAMWLPVCCVRATKLKELVGGWSATFARIMQAFFIDGFVPELGICLPGLDDGRPALWFFKFGYLLADTQAIQFTLGAKGLAGNAPCPLCANVTNIGSASLAAHDRTGLVVDIACASYGSFAKRTSRDLWSAVDRLSAARAQLGKVEFLRLQQALGFSLNPAGLLSNEALRAHVPIGEGLLFDPMHVLFNDGECHTELSLVIPRLAACRFGINYSKLRMFFSADWRRPSAHSHSTTTARLREAFNAARETHFRNTQSFGGAASEIRALVPVFAYMLEVLPGLRDELPQETASFAALAKVVRLWAESKHRQSQSGRRLMEAIEDHAVKKAEAYGKIQGVFKFKSHAVFHIAEQCESGIVPDAFVCERLHNAAKTRVADVKNTVAFERSSLERSLLECVRKWDDVDLREGMLDPKQSADGTLVSLAVRWRGCLVSAGDVVVSDGDMLEVRGACRVAGDGRTCLVAVRHAFVDSPAPGAAYWSRRSDGLELVPLASTVSFEIPQWFSFSEARGQILTVF